MSENIAAAGKGDREFGRAVRGDALTLAVDLRSAAGYAPRDVLGDAETFAAWLANNPSTSRTARFAALTAAVALLRASMPDTGQVIDAASDFLAWLAPGGD